MHKIGHKNTNKKQTYEPRITQIKKIRSYLKHNQYEGKSTLQLKSFIEEEINTLKAQLPKIKMAHNRSIINMRDMSNDSSAISLPKALPLKNRFVPSHTIFNPASIFSRQRSTETINKQRRNQLSISDTKTNFSISRATISKKLDNYRNKSIEQSKTQCLDRRILKPSLTNEKMKINNKQNKLTTDIQTNNQLLSTISQPNVIKWQALKQSKNILLPKVANIMNITRIQIGKSKGCISSFLNSSPTKNPSFFD